MILTIQKISVTAVLLCCTYVAWTAAMPAVASHDDTFHSPVEISGYAWSSNIGWISFNCSNTSECGTSNYKVRINNDAQKTLTGYAWSSNIGWIQFGGLSGCPSGSCDARLDSDTNEISGWARALSNGDGWDGWISLNCLNTGGCGTSSYAVTASPTGFSSNSYAWDSGVVGWASLSLGSFTSPCNANNICTVDLSGVLSTNMWCETAAPVACSSGNLCSTVTNACEVANAAGDLVIVPAITRRGDTIDISTKNMTGATECRVSSSDGGTYASVPVNTGSITSDPITFATTVFTLYCKSSAVGSEIEVDEKTLRIIPTIFES